MPLLAFVGGMFRNCVMVAFVLFVLLKLFLVAFMEISLFAMVNGMVI